MNQAIDRIYEAGVVIGRSGLVHQLHSAIDREEGEFLFSEDHITEMIAFRKTEEDSRNWDWHVDAF